MKKTLLITLDFPPQNGGVANYWANLLKHLPEERLVVLAPEYDNSLDFDIEQKYLIYRKRLISHDRWVWPKWLPFLWQSFKVCRMEKPDQLIVGQVLPGGTVAWLLKKFLNTPYILSFHGLDIAMAQKTSKKRKLFKMLVNSAEKIIVNSNFTKNKLLEVSGRSNLDIEVVYPGASIIPIENYNQTMLEDIKERYNIKNKQVLLSVGRLVERKGFDQAIRAMVEVKKRLPFVHYLIVGRGSDKNRLESIIHHHNLHKYVTILTDISNEELPYLYQLADLFVMPSRELADGDVEGFGIVYLEANLFKIPVLAGNSGGVPEAVEDGVSGVLVDPHNISDIQQKMYALLDNKEQLRHMGELAEERVKTKFDWQIQAEKLEVFLS
ncbi:hypothetical protein COT97_01580 [Candidatus Falkowbacteria bacterium CG10_big_fil_rev_8_21_14_0_10_39_11]|uniref:Glycosyltransferase family 4 protein n=1 Tax=Candidatus Falkowbacteria bacterium CG10_big_fil_rev_8_21_14_0_10_39_11 TaxID=1974565 RepID=A0A2H0V7L5_9BACT|nr:MAG: hypothetical protein COT97_01580 [Candidatus Falkowbacteria bacterium CG10_big_fil_rev_8_21_14_0_10_39_11]